MKTLFELLTSVHPLSEALVQELVRQLRHRELKRKEYLLKAGRVCRKICFVEEGLLRCFYKRRGHEVTSWFMREGDVIISIESFYQQKESYESIQALEDCSLYYISYEVLQEMYREYPEFNFVGRVLTEKYYTLWA